MSRVPSVAFGLAALIGGFGISATPSTAQATTLDGVLGICQPLIAAEYKGNLNGSGACLAAVNAYVASLGAPSDAANPQIAALALALAALYQPGTPCLSDKTELPAALSAVAGASNDADQKGQIIQVSDAVKVCDTANTASVADNTSTVNTFATANSLTGTVGTPDDNASFK